MVMFAAADHCLIKSADFAEPVGLAAHFSWLDEDKEAYWEYGVKPDGSNTDLISR